MTVRIPKRAIKRATPELKSSRGYIYSHFNPSPFNLSIKKIPIWPRPEFFHSLVFQEPKDLSRHTDRQDFFQSISIFHFYSFDIVPSESFLFKLIFFAGTKIPVFMEC